MGHATGSRYYRFMGVRREEEGAVGRMTTSYTGSLLMVNGIILKWGTEQIYDVTVFTQM